MITWAMARKTAASVPGRMGIHWSAKAAAESVYLGSTQMNLAPFSFACMRAWATPVPSCVVTGFQLHMTMRRASLYLLILSPDCRGEGLVPKVVPATKLSPSLDMVPQGAV